ncbi:MAG: TatD family hydrolase [Deltaproteobacteria bacterium]|nr:TatD family hydrolase [Deltaproteobacteria bacterium]
MRLDSHIHLDVMTREERGSLLFAAPDYRAFVPGIEPAAVAAALACFAADPRLAFGTALHPWFLVPAGSDGSLHPHDDPRWPQLEAQARDPRICAIGECGLDHLRHTDDLSRDRAESFFVAQIQLAVAVHKPLVLHCVRAHARCVELLRQHHGDRGGGLVHAFSGSPEEAAAYRRLGFVVGIGSAVTRAASKRVRAVAALLPADGFVLETDAPYMRAGEPPESAPAARGTVDDLTLVAETVAALRNTDADAIYEATADTAMRRLGLASLPPRANLGIDAVDPP